MRSTRLRETQELGELATELMQRTILEEHAEGSGLCLHSDNGASMTSSTLKATLERLGVIRSLSRLRVSDDNAFVESLFRTLKYRPDYPKFKSDVDCWREWVKHFVQWYNEEHRHSGIAYVTPSQRHLGLDDEILKQLSGLVNRTLVVGVSRFVIGPNLVW